MPADILDIPVPERGYWVPDEVRNGEVGEVEGAFLTMLVNCGMIVHHGQQVGDFTNEVSWEKPDGTVASKYDELSDYKAREIFEDRLPGVGYRGEEIGSTAGYVGFDVGVDPLDGSRPHGVGMPTSTVIAGAYNKHGNIFGAGIIDPATGRVFSSFEDQPLVFRLMVRQGDEIMTALKRVGVRTSNRDVGPGGEMFTDYALPFSRLGRATFTAAQLMAFRDQLQADSIGLLEGGSNGAHQLYVAGGRDRALGGLTTARGVIEDTEPGAHLIKQAGGVVKRLSVVNGVITPLEDNLILPEYDGLAFANKQSTLDHITDILGRISLKAG
jgi:hypothetical protein